MERNKSKKKNDSNNQPGIEERVKKGLCAYFAVATVVAKQLSVQFSLETPMHGQKRNLLDKLYSTRSFTIASRTAYKKPENITTCVSEQKFIGK